MMSGTQWPPPKRCSRSSVADASMATGRNGRERSIQARAAANDFRPAGHSSMALKGVGSPVKSGNGLRSTRDDIQAAPI